MPNRLLIACDRAAAVMPDCGRPDGDDDDDDGGGGGGGGRPDATPDDAPVDTPGAGPGTAPGSATAFTASVDAAAGGSSSVPDGDAAIARIICSTLSRRCACVSRGDDCTDPLSARGGDGDGGALATAAAPA